MRVHVLIALLPTFTLTACLDTTGPETGVEDTSPSGPRGGKGDNTQDEESLLDTRVHREAGESWTYMIYMMADNDLEAAGMDDLREMAQVGSSQNFNIVVLADRSPDYDDEGVLNLENWVDTKTLVVREGELEVVKEHGELDLGDPQNLVDFVSWTVENYPAERYALSFWDHGGSWNGGFGPDETSLTDPLNDGTLHIADFEIALPAALDAAGITQFDFIGFDTCLLGTWSQIQNVKPYAEYMLASEELEPGDGWDYTALELIKGVPSTPKMFGEALLSRYAAHHEDPWITLSLIDLYALDDLDVAITLFASDLYDGIDTHAVTLARARARVKEYGSPDGGDPSVYGTVDLGALITALAEEDPTFAPRRDEILAGLERAVVDQVAGPAAPEATGVAIYMPQYSVLYDSAYLTLGLDGLASWAFFVSQYASYGPSGDAPAFGELESWPELQVRGNELALQAPMQVNPETLVEARAPYGFVLEDGILLFGEEIVEQEGDVVKSSWDGSYLEMVQGEKSAPVYFEQRRDASGFLKASLPMYYLPPNTEGFEAAREATLVYTINEDTGEEHTRLFSKTRTGTIGELVPEEGSSLVPYVYWWDEETLEKIEYTLDDDLTFDATEPYGFRITGYGTATHFMMIELYGVIGLSDIVYNVLDK